jgi:ribonucleoside-triphosphate reductase
MEFTLCLDCGKTGRGIKDTCEFCGSANVDGIARITGYMASLSSYNEAKKEERKRRLKYEI